MTTPRTDTGWRKAAVTMIGIAAVVALAMTDHISGTEALAGVGTLAGTYLGINLFGYRRAQ